MAFYKWLLFIKFVPGSFSFTFIVLPIVFRSELREVIVHTYKSSGLTKIIEKLGNQKNVDQLYSIHFSAENYKLLSLQSIHIAEATQLVFVEKETAKIFPLLQKPKKMDNLDSQKIVDAAEKLGIWCSNMTIHEIGNLLKVRF